MAKSIRKSNDFLSRPQQRRRKLRNGKPFYWSGGNPPSTERGKRRHAERSPEAAAHAKAVWGLA